MFEQLKAAVDDLGIPLHGDALATVLRLRDRLDARLAVAAARYERSGQWEIEGATSMTAWLRDRAGQTKPQANRLRLTGRRLVELPGVASAAVAGTLSGGQVQAIVQAVTDDTVGAFADQEPGLVATLAGLGPADTATVLGHWQAMAATAVGADDHVDDEPARSLYHSAWQTALCDCTLHRLLHTATSATLDAGRATRTISRSLWNALVIRDEHCRFPGCDRPAGWCEAHHVQPWEHDGRTDQTNLVLVCSRHHHQLHTPGWHTKLLPDATLQTTSPDSTTRTSRPPGQLRPGTHPEPRRPP